MEFILFSFVGSAPPQSPTERHGDTELLKITMFLYLVLSPDITITKKIGSKAKLCSLQSAYRPH